MPKVTVPAKQSKYDTIAKAPKSKARDSIARKADTKKISEGRKARAKKGLWA
jgi:hypothetical protein